MYKSVRINYLQNYAGLLRYVESCMSKNPFFTTFLREKNNLCCKNYHFFKNQYFLKRLGISLDIFMSKIKKFVVRVAD